MHLRHLLAFASTFAFVLSVAGPFAASGTPSPQASPAAAVSQPTALLVSATNAPLSVRGTDGSDHLEYDLIVTNVFTAPVTLTGITVTTSAGQELLQLTGAALVALTQTLPRAQTATLIHEIPTGESVAVPIDVVVPAGQVPQRLTHRITYTLAPTPAATIIGSREIDGPTLTVDPFQPPVIAPPLHGAGWADLNGCCDLTSAHRSVRLVADGTRWVKPETFAIDWVQVQGTRLFTGSGTRNEQYFSFGAPVTAVADGTVVAVQDGAPEGTPNQPPTSVKLPSDYGGNGVVEQIAPGVWAMYEHLQPGSIAVRVGEKVATGQVLGKLGNTGNSTAPHLHFQLCDGPTILACNSLPFELNDFIQTGTIDIAGSTITTIHVVGPSAPKQVALPLELTADTFP